MPVHEAVDYSTLKEMTKSHDFSDDEYYGLGWQVKLDEKYGTIIEHGGSQAGASSFLKIYLDKKVVSAVIANNTYSDNEVFFSTRDLSYIMLDTTEYKKSVDYYTPIKKGRLQSFVGNYELVDKVLTITVEDDQLFGQLHPHHKAPFYPKSKDEFFCRYFDGELKFNQVNDKTISVKYSYKGKPEIYTGQN